MSCIRALALCAIVALVFAGCAAATEVSADLEMEMEVPRPHTTTLLVQDPWAIEPGLPIAQEDPELAAAWAEIEEPSVMAPTSTPCATKGGVCQANSNTCNGGKYLSGLCPGLAANVQCCVKPATKTEVVPDSPCKTKGGVCKEASAGCSGGAFQSGLCPGLADSVKCCVAPGTKPGAPATPAAKPDTPAAAPPSNAKEPASPCKSKGGFCKETSTGCSGTFASGLCPDGAATVKCCLSASQYTAFTKEAASACGPYAGKSGTPIRGNGGQTYNAVAIVKEHMSEPYKFGWSVKDADNTLEVKTACAFAKMHSDALKEGVRITIASGFRTLSRQQYFYDCMNCGCCNNGNLAAVPGSSNHGIGLAMDLNSEGKGVYNWLARNGQKYGFVRTVPSEDWHWEYRVGWSRAPYT